MATFFRAKIGLSAALVQQPCVNGLGGLRSVGGLRVVAHVGVGLVVGNLFKWIGSLLANCHAKIGLFLRNFRRNSHATSTFLADDEIQNFGVLSRTSDAHDGLTPLLLALMATLVSATSFCTQKSDFPHAKIGLFCVGDSRVRNQQIVHVKSAIFHAKSRLCPLHGSPRCCCSRRCTRCSRCCWRTVCFLLWSRGHVFPAEFVLGTWAIGSRNLEMTKFGPDALGADKAVDGGLC